MAKVLFPRAKDGGVLLGRGPSSDAESQPSQPSQSQPSQGAGQVTPSQPQSSRSLELFFRKLYHLAYSRLQRVCALLRVGEDTVRRIWTCFEAALTTQHDLFVDRHMDQILLATIYGICKVSCDTQVHAVTFFFGPTWLLPFLFCSFAFASFKLFKMFLFLL